MEYMIVHDYEIERFQATVNAWLGEGFGLYRDLVVCVRERAGRNVIPADEVYFYQVMVRLDE